MRAIFIPGLVSDDRAWVAVAQRLAQSGYSTGIADLSTPDSIASMASAVLEQFDGPLLPVGHSMGGRVALEMARQAPQRLAGLVLVATGAHPVAEGEIEKRLQVIDLANQQGMQALCDQWLPPMLAPGTRESNPDLYRTLQQMVLDAGAALHERQIRALMSRPDARPVLGQLAVPTLFVAGEFDGWSTPQQHRSMAVGVGDAEVVQIDRAGHFLQAEVPEAFCHILVEWIRRKGVA